MSKRKSSGPPAGEQVDVTRSRGASAGDVTAPPVAARETGSLEDDFNSLMWAGFIQFAVNDPDARRAFTEATGVKFLPPPKNAIEAAIDRASGAADSILEQFVEWVTINVWGLECAPKAYREELARKNKHASQVMRRARAR